MMKNLTQILQDSFYKNENCDFIFEQLFEKNRMRINKMYIKDARVTRIESLHYGYRENETEYTFVVKLKKLND